MVAPRVVEHQAVRRFCAAIRQQGRRVSNFASLRAPRTYVCVARSLVPAKHFRLSDLTSLHTQALERSRRVLGLAPACQREMCRLGTAQARLSAMTLAPSTFRRRAEIQRTKARAYMKGRACIVVSMTSTAHHAHFCSMRCEQDRKCCTGAFHPLELQAVGC